jgi:hypothetical protein
VHRLPRRLLQGAERRHHAVEERQRQHRPHAPENRASRYRVLRDDHCRSPLATAMLNGGLVTIPEMSDDQE